MKRKKTLFKALMALLVIMLGVNFNADAQLGGLVNKAKQAGKNAAKETKKQNSPDALQDAAKGASEDAIKKQWWDETAKLFEEADSTSSILDRCRAFYYAKKKYKEATNNGANDLDFLLVYTERVVISYILVKDLNRDEFLNSQKGLSWDSPYDKLTRTACDDVNYEIFSGGSFPVEVINLANGQENTLNQPFQDISLYIKETLDNADKCKTNEAKLVCLYRAIVNREKYTVEFPNTYPTDENMYTERIKRGVAALPADLLAENPMPEVLSAAELIDKRIEKQLIDFDGPVTTPNSRDNALEQAIKVGVESRNPGAKVKLVSFASDATASWNVEVNIFGIPVRRSKTGNIVVEYPGKAGLDLITSLTVYQQYTDGQYGKSDPNPAIKQVRVDKDMIFVKGLLWLRCKM
jgi:hypothetical protein